jgi:hypothetical protein
MTNLYIIWVGKGEGKNNSRRPKHRQKGSIQMDLQEINYLCGTKYGLMMGFCEWGIQSLGIINGR